MRNLHDETSRPTTEPSGHRHGERCEPLPPALIVATAFVLVASLVATVIIAPVIVCVLLLGMTEEPSPSSLSSVTTGHLGGHVTSA